MCALTVFLPVLVFCSSCLIPPSICRSIVSRRFCDAGQYLDVQRDTCRNCTTTCPENQIIRRTCSAVTDSVCGPFFEFRPEYKDAEKNRVMQRQKAHRPKPKKQWYLLKNDTAAEYSSPFASPPPPEEPDIGGNCCWTNLGGLAILISVSLICVAIAGTVALILYKRFLRSWKSRAMSGY